MTITKAQDQEAAWTLIRNVVETTCSCAACSAIRLLHTELTALRAAAEGLCAEIIPAARHVRLPHEVMPAVVKVLRQLPALTQPELQNLAAQLGLAFQVDPALAAATEGTCAAHSGAERTRS